MASLEADAARATLAVPRTTESDWLAVRLAGRLEARGLTVKVVGSRSLVLVDGARRVMVAFNDDASVRWAVGDRTLANAVPAAYRESA